MQTEKTSRKTIILSAALGAAVMLALVILAIILISVGMNGYTGRSYSNNYSKSSDVTYDSNYADYDVAAEGESSSLTTNTSAKTMNVDNKSFADGEKVVYSGDVSISVKNISAASTKLQEKMEMFNAKFESIEDSSYSKYMTIRVPKNNFMAFYDSLSDLGGEITSSNISMEDMSKTYTDNERRIDILESEYDDLKKLMDSAKNVKEVLSIKDRLSDITYELETLKGANKEIDYDVDFATMTVTLHPEGSQATTSFGYQIREAFSDSIYAVKMLFLGLIRIWWLILIIAALITYGIRKIKAKNAKTEKENTTRTQDSEPEKEEEK